QYVERIDVYLRYGYAIVRGAYKDNINIKELEESLLNYNPVYGYKLPDGEIFLGNFNSIDEIEQLAKFFNLRYKTLYNETYGTDYWGVTFSRKEPEIFGYIKTNKDAINYYINYGVNKELIENNFLEI
ncbi:MAG: hypothetical protein GX913_00895, partial [Clostridiales bacterium]|nr:hypothetical protein [Clostridiales bacterium]